MATRMRRTVPVPGAADVEAGTEAEAEAATDTSRAGARTPTPGRAKRAARVALALVVLVAGGVAVAKVFEARSFCGTARSLAETEPEPYEYPTKRLHVLRDNAPAELVDDFDMVIRVTDASITARGPGRGALGQSPQLLDASAEISRYLHDECGMAAVPLEGG